VMSRTIQRRLFPEETAVFVYIPGAALVSSTFL
jgi:hypothetical protein